MWCRTIDRTHGNGLECYTIKVRYWSDAKIVLAWIKSNPEKHKKFIASRIKKINKLSNRNNWYHVATENNAADCASRGLSPNELIEKKIWWDGPEFLLYDDFELPKTDLCVDGQCAQIQSVMASNAVISGPAGGSALPVAATFDKLIEGMAIEERRKNNGEIVRWNSSLISSDELLQARRTIIQILQEESFADEIRLLRGEKLFQNQTP